MMKRRLLLNNGVVVAALMAGVSSWCLADTGPKPTMQFEYIREAGPKLKVLSGQLMETEKPDGSEAKPLAVAGPQRFSCSDKEAYALAYGFSTYHRLELVFSDKKTRKSNVFKTAGFNAKYTVTIRESDLVVAPK